ncbi:hypothetical protein EDD85DRAFT_771744, partial [Armillaria nabsnona]
ILTYDIACQYHAKLKEHFKKCFLQISNIIDIINCLVLKMHLDRHIDNCKYCFSLNFFRGSEQTHGEEIKQSWAESKQSSRSMRQMNHRY